MFLTTPESARWCRWSFCILLLLTVFYIVYSPREGSDGGTLVGIIYGIVGLVLILILLFLGIRKRMYKSRLGKVESWVYSHVYLGLLVLFIILFHSGFHFDDTIALIALIMLIAVVMSGVFGTIFYNTLPRLLNEGKSNLTPSQMSDQINQFAQSMANIASGKSNQFQAIYTTLLNEEYPGIMAGWRILFGQYIRKRKERNREGGLQSYLGQVATEEQGDLRELLVLSRRRKEMNDRLIYYQRYKNRLELWLYIHLPLSIAMMVAIVAHITSFFYYGCPIGGCMGVR